MSETINIWSGGAESYDTYRPQSPPILIDILTQLAHMQRPQLVVDLGSGTGLSTVAWTERAERVIGIEPNADMRSQANLRISMLSHVKNVSYQDGLSIHMNIASDSADIVTCSQSLHWMEPEPTFAEIARILRPGGVFAAYDYDLPPTVHWEAEQVENKVMERFRTLRTERGLDHAVKSWSKEKHLERMQASNLFQYTKEIAVHNVESGKSDRFIGFVISLGSFRYLKEGVTEQELGLDQLRDVANKVIGDEPVPWYLSYRVRIGIK